jgi:hypothetical protein
MNATKGVKPRPEDRRMMARLRQPIIAALFGRAMPAAPRLPRDRRRASRRVLEIPATLPLSLKPDQQTSAPIQPTWLFRPECDRPTTLYGMEINEARSALAFVMGWWEGVSHAA